MTFLETYEESTTIEYPAGFNHRTGIPKSDAHEKCPHCGGPIIIRIEGHIFSRREKDATGKLKEYNSPGITPDPEIKPATPLPAAAPDPDHPSSAMQRAAYHRYKLIEALREVRPIPPPGMIEAMFITPIRNALTEEAFNNIAPPDLKTGTNP